MRYWFTTEESKAIQLFNKQYESTPELSDMIQCLYRTPEEGEQVNPIPLTDIVTNIKSEFPDINEGRNLNIKVGCKMTELGFTKKKLTRGIVVYAIPRDAA